MRFIVNNEPATSIDDFSIDRTFNNDLRARLDCQVGKEISADVQGAVLLNNGVVNNRAVYVRRADNERQLFCGFLY